MTKMMTMIAVAFAILTAITAAHAQNYGTTTYRTYGNTTFGSDGSTYSRHGDTTYATRPAPDHRPVEPSYQQQIDQLNRLRERGEVPYYGQNYGR